MKTRIIGSVLTLSLMAFYACGETRTWTGGGIDANWSTPENWGGTAPAANDTLVFNGTSRLASTNNFSADTSFAGIVFNSGAGAFSLGGNRLTLAGNVSNLSTSAQTLNLDMVLTETRVFDASNGVITINSALSGAGGLTKTGPQTLTLTASNSYDGVTTVTNGLLDITHGYALGSTNGNTVVNALSGGYLQVRGNIIVPEELFLDQQRTSGVGKYSLYIPSGSNTLSGQVTCNATRIHSATATTLILTGGLTNMAGYLVLNNPAGSTMAFYDKPISSRYNRLYLEGTGLTIIGVAGNVWTPAEIVSSATLRTDVAGALPPDAPFRMTTSSGATLDLNGFDQTISEIATLSVGTIRSDIPATLTVNQTSTTTFNGKLTGTVNLLMAGTGTLILSNATSTTTGNITVTNGTLTVALTKSLGNSTNIILRSGTLDLRVPDGIVDTANLSISNSAIVNIKEGVIARVGQLFLNGLQQKSGTWGTTASGAAHQDNTHFSGTGVINVLNSPPITAINATWDGEGVDTLLSTAANWLGDTLPVFDGTTHTIFGTGGSTTTVNTAASVYGMTFNRAGDFTLANGDGALTLGSGGITAESPDTTSRTYTISEDLALIENPTWHVATNGLGVTSLIVTGAISDDVGTYGYTKTGDGELTLSGNNAYDGTTIVKAGRLTITHPNALGSTNGITEVDCMNGGAYLNLRGSIDVAEPFLLNGQRPLAKSSIYNESGSNTLSGPIMRKLGGVGFRIHLAYGTTLIIRGGLTGLGGGGYHIFNNNSGFLALYDKPMVIAPADVVYFELLGLTVLGVSGNVWGQTSIIASGTLRMGAVNALPNASTLYIQNNNAILDLDGFNQSVSGITHPSTGVITSAVPATLTLNQSANATFSGRLTGAVSLLKAGSGALTLSNSLNNTTGDITVTNGTLAAASENSLGNSTNIIVTGTAARLDIQAPLSIVNTATLTIAENGAKVNLATGVNETIGWLYLGKTMQRAGTYGSTTSAAVHKDNTLFSGTGMLTVLHDKSGTLMSLR